jgi:hypothetical protein
MGAAEHAMIEFANILAYDLGTLVLMVGTAVMVTAGAVVVARMNRVPTTVRALDLAPAFGL